MSLYTGIPVRFFDDTFEDCSRNFYAEIWPKIDTQIFWHILSILAKYRKNAKYGEIGLTGCAYKDGPDKNKKDKSGRATHISGPSLYATPLVTHKPRKIL